LVCDCAFQRIWQSHLLKKHTPQNSVPNFQSTPFTYSYNLLLTIDLFLLWWSSLVLSMVLQQQKKV
jgi:hypothetical protein